jgi:hypothetical protein
MKIRNLKTIKMSSYLLKKNFLAMLILLFLGIITITFSPVTAETEVDDDSDNSDGLSSRDGEPIVTPANNSQVNWHDLNHILVDYGTPPNISGAQISVVSNVTGPITVTPSVSGNTIRINLPLRDCALGQGEIFYLCPGGEVITMNLTGVRDSPGNALPDLANTFKVGTARLVIQSPQEGDYVGSNVDVIFSVENHTISGGVYGGPHMHYMYDEIDAGNFKLHFSSDPITYTTLPEGYHPLIIDLRTPNHIWLGTPESRLVIGVTVDTVKPAVVTEQVRPLPDSKNVDKMTNITVQFNEQISDGSKIELSADDIPVPGNLSLITENERSTLIFTPTEPLAEKATYTVEISGVKDLAGNQMIDYDYTFTIIGEGEASVSDKEGEENLLVRFWEPVTVVGAAMISLIGWLMIRRQRANVRSYLDQIDQKVGELRDDFDRLDEELTKLRDELTKLYRKGRLDENQFLLVEKKLDDSLSKARERNIAISFEQISPELKKAITTALSDGRVKSEEMDQVLNKAGELTEAQKAQLKEIMSDWVKKDEIGQK